MEREKEVNDNKTKFKILNFAKFAMLLWLPTSEITKKSPKTDHSIAICSNFLIGMVYFGCHLVNPHVQTVQNMYGKGG